jgi:chromosome segregation ATPase
MRRLIVFSALAGLSVAFLHRRIESIRREMEWNDERAKKDFAAEVEALTDDIRILKKDLERYTDESVELLSCSLTESEAHTRRLEHSICELSRSLHTLQERQNNINQVLKQHLGAWIDL